ncbi:RagB/SusD family nutrient uptake outer membrane protein [Adhaeribacter arboris]|uniref:RagB/SusD family nutrient uptake outer membrane protein n=2 Tax=Adhaeribacter arboris TaxID=2072846 RepID=A0A2T2YPJ1_9BACT|nr:RagB/SusD family nutrient uptake outer membrane protein [Adhaeribacter arboris]
MLALTAASCNDRLDIEPQDSVDVTKALTTSGDVESAVIGMYSLLGTPELYGTNLNLLPELLASDNYISWQGTFASYRTLARHTLDATNAEASRTWISGFEAINLANTVIKALPVVDADLKAQLEGEALFVRGIMHFELVRLYAQNYEPGGANTQLGVPIALQSAANEAEAAVTQPRATVAEVYQQVIADLIKAESLLPESSDRNIRATKYVASAFLARVYLQQGDYAKALEKANSVIASGNYNLNPIVSLAFRNRNTAESIFEIQQNDQNNAGNSNDGLTTFYASLPGNIGRGDVRILGEDDIPQNEFGVTTLYQQFEPNDTRLTDLIYEGTGARPGRLRNGKYTEFGANIPVVRLAEMYLIRAEANFRLGSGVGAEPLEDINLIRNRAKATPLTTVTLEDILLERQFELAYEGFRVHDLKRTQGQLLVLDNDGLIEETISYDDPILVLPIPQREMDANKLLVQNEGY